MKIGELRASEFFEIFGTNYKNHTTEFILLEFEFNEFIEYLDESEYPLDNYWSGVLQRAKKVQSRYIPFERGL